MTRTICSLTKLESIGGKEIGRTVLGECINIPRVGCDFTLFSARPEDRGGLKTSEVVAITPKDDGLVLMTENSIYFYKELEDENDSVDSNTISS